MLKFNAQVIRYRRRSKLERASTNTDNCIYWV